MTARHRLLTVPGGVLAFAGMFLPSSSSCGETWRPIDDPAWCWPYAVGLAIAVVAILSSAARRERVLAIAAVIVGMVGTAMSVVEALFASTLLIGVELRIMASLALWIGGVVWLFEISDARREGPPPRRTRTVALLALALLAAYAAIALTAPVSAPPPTSAPDGSGFSWPSADDWARGLQSAAHGG
jgi:hypothetical protein